MNLAKLLRSAFGGHLRHREAQAYIVSYPKSGRTWLRLLLGKVLCDKYAIDPAQMLNTLRLTSLAKATPTRFSHDGSGMREGSHYTRLETSKVQYANRGVVLLVRDPRDVMVSCYFQATKRINVYQGSISEFIRDERFGIHKCVNFYSIWGENQHVPAAFLLVRYEDMHANPQSVLKQVLEFIGVSDVSLDLLDTSVEFGRFENMKRMEATGQFKRQVLTPGNSGDEESYKVRRGKVGGYSDYLSSEDRQFLTQAISEAQSPILDWYSAPGSQGGRFTTPQPNLVH